VNLTTPARPQFPAGDAFRPNPLVDDLRRSDPTLHRLASAEGPPPSLFSGGDLPMTTASGLDPAILARVPWMARHAVAAARTSAEAYRIVEDTSGPDGELHAHTYADHPGVRAYEARVRNWAVGLPGQTPADSKAANREISEALAEELHGRLFPPDSRP
jgi:hypothetical protein